VIDPAPGTPASEASSPFGEPLAGSRAWWHSPSGSGSGRTGNRPST